MAFPHQPYLPPPPQELLVPPSSISSPPGLQPTPGRFQQLCPGLPRQFLMEHQELLDRMVVQQQQMVIQQQQQQQLGLQQHDHQQEQQQLHQRQQHQQLLQQQKLHRAHLELGAAHQRVTHNDERTARLEIKVEELEYKRTETKKKYNEEMAAVNVELEEGRAFLLQANANMSDLKQLVQEQWVLWDQQQQEIDQVNTNLSDLQQLRTLPPPSPQSDLSSQAGSVLEQEVPGVGLQAAIHQATQTPAPLLPPSALQPFSTTGDSTLADLPSPQQEGCLCGSAMAAQDPPVRRPLPPPDGVHKAARTFPSLRVTLLLTLAILGGLGIPACMASTLVTPPPLSSKPSRGAPEMGISPPPGSTGSGTRGRPVSQEFTLEALKCPASTARLYPVEAVCGVDGEVQPKPFSTTNAIRRRAYLLQHDRLQTIKLWKCTKHVSTKSVHCGFESWSSPEGPTDKTFEPTAVLPQECRQAVRQSIWTDPSGSIHQVQEGVNVLNYVSLGSLDYSSSSGTYSCRGGDRTNSAGNQETSVFETQSVQFSIKSMMGIYSTVDKSIQVSSSIVLPRDRWSSYGTASVEGEVYLQDSPGTPPPTCSLKLIRGPLDFLIFPPVGDTPFFTAVNIPSRVKINYQQPEVPIPKSCLFDIGQHRRTYRTNYKDILLLVEDNSASHLPNVSLPRESLEVHLPLQERSRLDYLDWSLQLRLEDMTAEIRKTRCLQSLYEDYSSRSSQRPGWRMISRGEIMVLVRCEVEIVRPLLTASTCSKQLSVVDAEGKPWRLHSKNRLLTDYGEKVPCGPPSPVFAFKTMEGSYISQSPRLQVVPMNLNSSSRGNTIPSFLSLEEDRLLTPRLNPFHEPGGLYSEEEIEGDQEQYLREWSLLVGIPPAALLVPEEASPPASAASSAHTRAFQSTSEKALQGVEAFLKGSLRSLIGRGLTFMEDFILTMLLTLGNLWGVVLLFTKVGSSIAHLFGCIGPGSTQSWQEAMCWACCGPLKLATTARRGFPAAPPPPQPSAPLLEQEDGGSGVGGDEGSPPPASSSSSKSLMKWRSSKKKKSKKKAQAPAAPETPDGTLTHLGYQRYSAAGPTALPPLLSSSSSAERNRRRQADSMIGLIEPGRTKTNPTSFCPAQSASTPPSTQGRGRAPKAPRGSIHQEEVEILLPPPDALSSDLAKVFFKKGAR